VKTTAKSLMNSATPAFPNSIHIAPRGHVAVITLFVATTLTGPIYAAPRFDPANEPQVYLAPIALSNADLRPVVDLRPNGGATAFRPLGLKTAHGKGISLSSMSASQALLAQR